MRLPKLALGMALACLASGAQPARRILWRDPGPIAAIDFAGPIDPRAPVPKPPFLFLKEDLSGTQPKVSVKDSAGVPWNVKFGFEVKPEAFTWRLPRALGYYVESSFFVPSGRIAGLGAMQRQSPSLKPDGQFINARFQFRDPALRFTRHTWTWTGNPFRGTPQLKGLAMLIMLASNWDNKDGRAGLDNTNTGIFERNAKPARELLYSFTDWGSGMGAWGHLSGQSNWNCADYTRQSSSFVGGVKDGYVAFGFEGHIRDGFQTGIRPADVAWLMNYLGQVTDAQLRAGLRASGAARPDEDCFTAAIRSRIEALRAVAAPRANAPASASGRRP